MDAIEYDPRSGTGEPEMDLVLISSEARTRL